MKENRIQIEIQEHTGISYRANMVFQTREEDPSKGGVETTNLPSGQKVKLDLVFTSHIKANSRWNEDFNIKNKPIKVLERNTGDFFMTMEWSQTL